jgi:hypothetical protein
VLIAKLLGVGIAAPSFYTLSRRGNGLTLNVQPQANGPAGIQLVVDSTGLKGIAKLFDVDSKRCCARQSGGHFERVIGPQMESI